MSQTSFIEEGEIVEDSPTIENEEAMDSEETTNTKRKLILADDYVETLSSHSYDRRRESVSTRRPSHSRPKVGRKDTLGSRQVRKCVC